MRERLVVAFVGLTLAVIGLYGVPRAYFLADLVRDQEAATLGSTATALSALVAERTGAGGDVDEALLSSGLGRADRVSYDADDGEPVVVGSRSDPEGGVTVTRRVDGGVLRLSVSGDTVGSEVREAITPLVLLGLALALGSALLGFLIARRLARPFQELAGLSRELGHGRFDLDVPTYAVPEAEAIGASLRTAAGQLDALVRREREFAVNASHQLRTPITALRLNLEDLSLWPETPEAVRAELQHGLVELDRLSGAIDELLDLARGQRLDGREEVDLALLVGALGLRWARVLGEEGRALALSAGDPVRVRVPARPVEQVLDVLVDNARVHGVGSVSLELRDAGTHLEVSVGDEGVRRFGPEVLQRGDADRRGDAAVGLAVAAELAERCGGHLSLDTASATTRFVLWLPRPEQPMEEPAG